MDSIDVPFLLYGSTLASRRCRVLGLDHFIGNNQIGYNPNNFDHLDDI